MQCGEHRLYRLASVLMSEVEEVPPRKRRQVEPKSCGELAISTHDEFAAALARLKVRDNTLPLCWRVPRRLKLKFAHDIRNETSIYAESDGDYLILKMPNTFDKSNIITHLYGELSELTGMALVKPDVALNTRDYRIPDLAFWCSPPSRAERNKRRMALVPNLWVEICLDERDRGVAMDKIEHSLLPRFGQTLSVLLVYVNHDCQLDLRTLRRESTAAVPKATQPKYTSFLAYWAAPSVAVQWFSLQPNQHVDLVMSSTTFRLETNVIMRSCSD